MTKTEQERLKLLKEKKRLKGEFLSLSRKKILGLGASRQTQLRRVDPKSPLPRAFIEALGADLKVGFQATRKQELRAFADRGGVKALGELEERGASSDFILSLFLNYLWREEKDVPISEHNSEEVQRWKESLLAVRKVKEVFPAFVTKSEGLQDVGDAEDFELALLGMEAEIQRFLKSKDFRDPAKRRPPNEKANRVIFTVYEHVCQRTGAPQWKLLVELLDAAGAIGVDVRERKDDVVTDNPNGRLRSHIKSFEQDHPKEAKFIPLLLKNPQFQALEFTAVSLRSNDNK